MKKITLSLTLIALSAIFSSYYFFLIKKPTCVVEFSSTDNVVDALIRMDQHGTLSLLYQNSFGPLKKISLRKSLSVFGSHSIYIEKFDGCANVNAYINLLKAEISLDLEYTKIFGKNYKNYQNDFCKMYKYEKNFVEENFIKKYVANFSTVEDFYLRKKHAEGLREICNGRPPLIKEDEIKNIIYSEFNNNFERLGLGALISYFVAILVLLTGIIIVFNFLISKSGDDE